MKHTLKEMRLRLFTISNFLAPLIMTSALFGPTLQNEKLADEQKQMYHQKYVEIVEEAMKQKSGVMLEVSDIDEFEEENWVEPEQFKENIQTMISQHLQEEREIIGTMNADEEGEMLGKFTKKSAYIYTPNILTKIDVNVHFETNFDEMHQRQLFISADRITSNIENPSKGEWKQTAAYSKRIDSGRTYLIQIEGILSKAGASIEKVFTIEYKVNEKGRIY